MSKEPDGSLLSAVESTGLVARWGELLQIASQSKSRHVTINRADIMEAIEQLTEMQQALRVIGVWAECGINPLEDPEDVLDDIFHKCHQTLNHFGATDQIHP